MRLNNTIATPAVTIGLLVTSAMAASRSFSDIQPDAAVEARSSLNAVQALRARSAQVPSEMNSILSGTERYDLEYFRGISQEWHPMTWAVSTQETLDRIDFQAS